MSTATRNPAADLPYGRQTIDDDDVAAVVAALRSARLTQGPQVDAFERELAMYVGAPYVSACANGTAALHLAYAALGLGPGDEIITSPVTFSATASAAHQLGATVRFADVDPTTGTLHPPSVEALVTPRTQGVVAVHLGGLPCELTALRHLCDRHGLWLVEDAAHALGAVYRGAPIGSCRYADATTFSFHPVKHITTGEGGAVAVRDEALKRRIDRLRHHGIAREPDQFVQPSPGPWYYEVQQLGYNYRLPDILCALGRAQLAKQPAWLARRRAIAARYRERLHGIVSLQREPSYAQSAYHLMIALVPFERYGCDRATVMRALAAAGIGTQVHYIPLSHHPYYRARYGDLPDPPGVAEYYRHALSLPMFPAMTDADVDRVADAVIAALAPAARRAAGGTP
ncbi:MAG: UDP-4-amino-4,6-dideoxy-N-acetyl-beta-L-altrosamine transaminase [Deltaproteobacteria bacterium]|nr:MAG: UDP-4-amino-4,6-dideoxy-N-acetyl-beta-L-altrosamine transaminase [Deltaproteobacteria bacterium]